MHWLLAYTKPRQEALAEERLRRRNCTWVEEPPFPRRLFVGATDDGVTVDGWIP